jgi:hypothetical protein
MLDSIRQLSLFVKLKLTNCAPISGIARGRFFVAQYLPVRIANFSCDQRGRRLPEVHSQHRKDQMPFQNGQSGNPAGRPRGARNKRTIALENIMEAESEVITRKAIEMAKGGHIAAIRMVIDRLAPVRKDRAVEFELPPLNTPADAVAASVAIAAAVAAGDLTPLEAAQLSKVVDGYVQALEAHSFEQRLARLEEDEPNRRASNGS